MLISSPDEHLGSRTHAACLEGEFFAEKVGLNFDLEAQFMNQNDVVKSKCEYEFWRIRLGQSFGMLAALIGLNLGSWGHIACLLDIFHLPQSTKILDSRPCILGDLVKVFKNVSANREDYE